MKSTRKISLVLSVLLFANCEHPSLNPGVNDEFAIEVGNRMSIQDGMASYEIFLESVADCIGNGINYGKSGVNIRVKNSGNDTKYSLNVPQCNFQIGASIDSIKISDDRHLVLKKVSYEGTPERGVGKGATFILR